MGKQIAVVDVKVKKPFDVGEFITNILLEGGSIRIIEVLKGINGHASVGCVRYATQESYKTSEPFSVCRCFYRPLTLPEYLMYRKRLP